MNDRISGKPKSADEFVRCLLWTGWDPYVAFGEGSKQCLNLKAPLIRAGLKSLRIQERLCRYTRAVQKIVRVSTDDNVLEEEWRTNLRQLRALLYTSAFGTMRQYEKLLEIAQNKQVTMAMRYALGQERSIEPGKIEASWVAVLYAEGSPASLREADRLYSQLASRAQSKLQKYRRR